MGVLEYRDTDVPDRGFCPLCYRELSGLTVEAKGFCEHHGWVFAEWFVPDSEEDDEAEKVD